MERKPLGFFLLLLIVLASQDQMIMPSEARVCESKSHKFQGPCVRDNNCGLVCKNEGFTGGKCRGFRRRCFCTKVC